MREWLGGFVACGVFALIYPFICLFLSLYLLFVLHLVCFVLVVFCLSSCLVLFVLVVFVVAFSLTDYTQKEKGAISCVLSCPVVSVQILVQLLKNSVAVALAFSNSFGLYSQLMQVASDGLPVLTLIFSGIMSI